MSKAEYDLQYNKTMITLKQIPFNKTKGPDIELLDWIAIQPNITQYVKGLIREDMRRKNDGEIEASEEEMAFFEAKKGVS